MDRHTEGQLTKWLTGDLDAGEARRLERRLAADPELAREAERLRRAWDALAIPEGAEATVPPGFSGRIMARVRDEAATPRLSWRAAPALVRAAGAAALVTGLLLGAALGGAGGGGTVAPVAGGKTAERSGPEAGRGAPTTAPAVPATSPATGPAAASGSAPEEDPTEDPTEAQVAEAAGPAGADDPAADDWSAVYADDAFSLGNLGDVYADALSSWGEEGT